MSWINDLDSLASANVLNFDAPAFVKDTQPRYYGNPNLQGLNEDFPNIKSQPKKDEFNNNGTSIKNPSWKTWTFNGILGAGLLFGGYKMKNVLFPAIKKLFTGKKV